MTLKEFREKKGWSLQKMAEFLGLKSRVSVFNYEKGRVPRKDIALRIEVITKGKVKVKDFYS